MAFLYVSMHCAGLQFHPQCTRVTKVHLTHSACWDGAGVLQSSGVTVTRKTLESHRSALISRVRKHRLPLATESTFMLPFGVR